MHHSWKTDVLCTGVAIFIEPENWPSNSPELNLVDYSILDALQQLVYREKIWDMQHLKDVLVSCREQISQSFIEQAVGQFWKWLASVIAVEADVLNIFWLWYKFQYIIIAFCIVYDVYGVENEDEMCHFLFVTRYLVGVLLFILFLLMTADK